MIVSATNHRISLPKWAFYVVLVTLSARPIGLCAQFSQDTLPFPYNALEPYLDAKTVEHRYQKYQAEYVYRLHNTFAELNEKPKQRALE